MSDEWIHVDDLEPKEGQRVLCVQDPTKTATKEALFAVFDGAHYCPPLCQREPMSRWTAITHWQPLPKTPKS